MWRRHQPCGAGAPWAAHLRDTEQRCVCQQACTATVHPQPLLGGAGALTVLLPVQVLLPNLHVVAKPL
jgi:hypothetical protein